MPPEFTTNQELPMHSPEEKVNHDFSREEITQVSGSTHKKIENQIQSGRPVIIGQDINNSLSESMQVFITPYGDVIYAGSDIGINYKKKRNEDRVGVNSQIGFAVVTDGMGGEAHGEIAAQILTESILNNPQNISSAIEIGRNKIIEQSPDQKSGACFVAAQIVKKDDQKFLLVHSAGDCELAVLKPDESVSFRSTVESVTNLFLRQGKFKSEKEAIRHPRNHIIYNSINTTGGEILFYPEIQIESGDRILMMSDGISDNLLLENLLEIIRNSKDSRDAYHAISTVTAERMYYAAKPILDPETDNFTDGYPSPPKIDNRALVIIDIA